MSQVDSGKEREEAVLKKLAEAAAELARLTNSRPPTKEQAEEMSRRAT